MKLTDFIGIAFIIAIIGCFCVSITINITNSQSADIGECSRACQIARRPMVKYSKVEGCICADVNYASGNIEAKQ